MNNMKNNRLEGIKIMFNKPPKWNDRNSDVMRKITFYRGPSICPEL